MNGPTSTCAITGDAKAAASSEEALLKRGHQ